LGGIPGFLSFLTTTCDPAAVVEAVVTGPAEHFAARAGVMVVKREETLSLIGSYGHGQAELDGLQEFPLDTDNPLCEAWREGETIVAGTKPVEGVFADLTPITARWAQLGVWQGQNTFACTPLTAHGTSIGAIGIICADERSCPLSTSHCSAPSGGQSPCGWSIPMSASCFRWAPKRRPSLRASAPSSLWSRPARQIPRSRTSWAAPSRQ
jgi:hypothetical protein